MKLLLALTRNLTTKSNVRSTGELSADCCHIEHAIVVLFHRLQDITMLVIAHRIQTIMDSDQIVVLRDGRVAEFGAPKQLLDTPHSHFKELLDVMEQQEP